jgi:hypothetical protein
LISSLFFHDSTSRQLLPDIRAGVSHMTTMSVTGHKNPEFMALLRILIFGLIDVRQRFLIWRPVRND